MEANQLRRSPFIVFAMAMLAAPVRRGDRDLASLAYSKASILVPVLLFHGMHAVARAPAGRHRQWLRAAVVALCVALTGLFQLLIYVPAVPLSMALATWAVSAVCLSAFFLVASATPASRSMKWQPRL